MKTIKDIRPAGPDHQVVTIESEATGRKCRRPKPCSDCPWRKDRVGEFPAEAFRHSASTGYDIPELMAHGLEAKIFSCHQSGAEKPADCAGFLLSKAASNNMSLRIRSFSGDNPFEGVDNPDNVPLFDDYFSMAVANGVPPDDPAITPCWRAPEEDEDEE